MGLFEDNNTYTGFAGVYDNFMDDIPYEAWSSFVKNLLEIYNVFPGESRIAELGCGTGTMTKIFLDGGYDIDASDLSGEMVELAKRKCEKYSGHVSFSQADMRSFRLKEPVKGIISLCDSVNYLVEDGDLDKLFSSVKANLTDGGVFIFDLKTKWLYENAMADNTFAETRSDCAYIWDNYYDGETGINEYALTLFLENEQGSYDRCEEIHLQKAYEPKDIKAAAERAGVIVEAIYGQEPFEKLLKEDERMFVVIKKPERK
ncbi:MAG: class I SAM-dependent DNA methyltransferase [Lachnospiraceae bacterium]